MEASALTHASRLGLLGRRSPLLRLQGDERLIALIREGHERAFETLFERYQVRLLAFCRGMLASPEDAEDILQEVFVAAHRAILADNRAIKARPWLYRIARNRCLNHLRKPVPEGQDSMDVHPHENGVSVADRVQKREEFRALIADVGELPETQRTALLLREIDAMAYEEIAVAMDTTVPAVKSLLVRARMSLADCSQGRQLTCDEVHLELAEAAEGLRKASGPARAHLRGCEHCRDYRAELRRSSQGAGGAGAGRPARRAHRPAQREARHRRVEAGRRIRGRGDRGLRRRGQRRRRRHRRRGHGSSGAAVGGAAAGGGGFSLAGGAAAGGLGGAIGTKAAASVASVALLTAGAVEVNNYYRVEAEPRPGRGADRARDGRSRSPRRIPSCSGAEGGRHPRGAGDRHDHFGAAHARARAGTHHRVRARGRARPAGRRRRPRGGRRCRQRHRLRRRGPATGAQKLRPLPAPPPSDSEPVYTPPGDPPPVIPSRLTRLPPRRPSREPAPSGGLIR